MIEYQFIVRDCASLFSYNIDYLEPQQPKPSISIKLLINPFFFLLLLLAGDTFGAILFSWAGVSSAFFVSLLLCLFLLLRFGVLFSTSFTVPNCTWWCLLSLALCEWFSPELFKIFLGWESSRSINFPKLWVFLLESLDSRLESFDLACVPKFPVCLLL